ncbi:MAG: hypothetical protein WA919_15525 [Coleofasciculaceae cyanobacterium]
MNSPWVKLVLIGLLLMMVTAPFAGLAPLMLILLVLGVFWALGSIAEILFTAPKKDEQASFESGKGE